MKVATGKVVSGKVVIEGDPLPNGAKVTVISREGDETFVLSPEDEAEILAAIAEVDRGETIDGEELLKSLGRRS
ncbi:MAG: hypothetical protein ACREQY_16545 [Candidatus Binatia bacterium]